LWENAPLVDGQKRLSACVTDRPFEEVRLLAMRLRERSATVVLFAGRDEKGMRLICTRSDDLDSPSAGELLQAAAEELGGRGGGSPTVAQGGAPETACAEIMAVFERVLGK
jgi:alanyl-tRNA synthetase